MIAKKRLDTHSKPTLKSSNYRIICAVNSRLRQDDLNRRRQAKTRLSCDYSEEIEVENVMVEMLEILLIALYRARDVSRVLPPKEQDQDMCSSLLLMSFQSITDLLIVKNKDLPPCGRLRRIGLRHGLLDV